MHPTPSLSSTGITDHAREIERGARFRFGENWTRFLATISEERIAQATQSLQTLLAVSSLDGRTFLDIGCGSGLFSLAARRLGAEVHSFDYDAEAVAAALELKHRYCPQDPQWMISQGSILDPQGPHRLESYDVVYAWGVLHHTGRMWDALANAAEAVKPNGLLAVAIYNDQGITSRLWRRVKHTYCQSRVGRWAVLSLFIPIFALQASLAGIMTGRSPWSKFTSYKRKRGMSIVHDWVDWLGGYPFEVAKVEQIFHFYRARGLRLINLTTTNRLGCHELVFQREGPWPPA